MKRILQNLSISFLIVMALAGCTPKQKTAKYVFYMIGDGMGLAQVCLAEAWLGYHDGEGVNHKTLSFTQFPVIGLASTYSHSNWITCSSAAGTALSTGSKTNNGFVCCAPDSTELTSIAYKIKQAGYAVGITSTVPMNHATPACFVGHSVSRGDYYRLGLQMCQSGFDLYGGGGIIAPTDTGLDQPSVFDKMEEAGYTLAYGTQEFDAKWKEADKLFFMQAADRHPEKELPYALDRTEGDLTHVDIMRQAIAYLEKKAATQKGFFLMSEGGKIDWAAHSNDMMGMIFETIDFADAIQVAVDFARKHPDETLIVVTADHETSGLALGDVRGYQLYFDKLEGHKFTKEHYKETGEKAPDFESDYHAAHLHCATVSHTGIDVPVYALGVGSELFGGHTDNTDLPKLIMKAMGLEF